MNSETQSGITYEVILKSIRDLMFNCFMAGLLCTMSIMYLYQGNKIGFGICGLAGIVSVWVASKVYNIFESGGVET